MLAIQGQGGFDTVDIGLGTLSVILGAITIDNVTPGLDNLTIDGQGHTLDGANTYRGLFVYSGAVAINNLSINDALAQGGTAVIRIAAQGHLLSSQMRCVS